jgi:hypothetical protein
LKIPDLLDGNNPRLLLRLDPERVGVGVMFDLATRLALTAWFLLCLAEEQGKGPFGKYLCIASRIALDNVCLRHSR